MKARNDGPQRIIMMFLSWFCPRQLLEDLTPGNAELRRELDDNFRRQDSHEVVFKLIAERMDPHIAYIDSNVVFDIDDTIGGSARPGWSRVDVDFDAACKDRRFVAGVAAIRNYTYDNLTDVMGREKRFRELLATVEKENAR